MLPIIRKTSILTDKDIRPLGDPHHIYFVQEVGAFPLRLIEGMDRMRTLYRAVSQADRNPLHTHQNYKQFQDIMPAPQSEVQTQQNLILAQALGLIKQEVSTVTGYPEMRLYYQDKLTGLEKMQVLGTDSEEAALYFLNDRNRQMREILDDALQTWGQRAVSKPQKQELYQSLTAYLKQQESLLPGGKDNLNYRKLEVAIEEYMKTFSLYVGTAGESRVSQPSPLPKATNSNSIPSSENNENLEKFTKLVETCCRRGKPSDTELNLLEQFRKKYNITPEVKETLVAQFTSAPNPQEVIYEFGLMYRAFLENDGEIDLEEQAQLLELQEELGITNDQVNTIEANIREELQLPQVN